MTLSKLNELLNTGIQVYWKNSMYEVKRGESVRNKTEYLVVVCSKNGSVSRFDDSYLVDCGINKWDMRESGFYQFNLIK